MYLKLCIRLGLVIGGAVGALVGLLYGVVCCTPPQAPSVGQLAVDGLLVAFVASLFCLAFAWLVLRPPFLQLLGLVWLIAVVDGVLLGPLAYQIPYDWLALVICAVLGAVLAWLVCRLACGRSDWFVTRKAR